MLIGVFENHSFKVFPTHLMSVIGLYLDACDLSPFLKNVITCASFHRLGNEFTFKDSLAFGIPGTCVLTSRFRISFLQEATN